MLWKKAIIKQMLDKAVNDLYINNVEKVIEEMLTFLNDLKQKRRLISKDRTDILRLLGKCDLIYINFIIYSESARNKSKEEFRSLIMIQIKRLVSLIYK